MQRLSLSQDDLAAARGDVQSYLRGAKVPSLLTEFEPGPYGLSRPVLDVLESLETGLAVVRPASEKLFETWPESSVQAAQAYALWLASSRVLHLLPRLEETSIKVGGAFNTVDMAALVGHTSVVAACIQDYAQYLAFYRNHPNPDKRVDVPGGIMRCTQAYFQLLGNALLKILQSGRDCDRVQALRVDVPGQRFEGCQVAQEAVPSDFLPVGLDDIVGNQEFVKAGKRLARDVAGFDMETRENPKRLNPVLFAMGDPGCGKTVTCHALGHFFLDFCAARNLPARFLTIRRSDWASSYQNASAAQLIDIFKTQVAGFPGVVGVYWPDIDTAFAAREDPGSKGEEKNILGACFGIFDGTIIPKNGQWFMLCDANTLNMDKATISRITQDPFTLKGPVSADDFVVLTRDKKLKGHQPFLELDESQWQQFGQRCLDMKLSGRSIENITRRVITEIEDFDFPEEYFHATLERRRDIAREQSQRISLGRLTAIIEHYKQFEQEAEERAYRARFQERVQEIVFNTSAHAAAIAINDPPAP